MMVCYGVTSLSHAGKAMDEMRMSNMTNTEPSNPTLALTKKTDIIKPYKRGIYEVYKR